MFIPLKDDWQLEEDRKGVNMTSGKTKWGGEVRKNKGRALFEHITHIPLYHGKGLFWAFPGDGEGILLPHMALPLQEGMHRATVFLFAGCVWKILRKR